MAENTGLIALVDVPNLDALDAEDLRHVAEVFSRLAAYADTKACARELRAEGDLEAATCFERTCDATYQRLPTWAQW